jgi:hypothetical protein
MTVYPTVHFCVAEQAGNQVRVVYNIAQEALTYYTVKGIAAIWEQHEDLGSALYELKEMSKENT